MRATLQHVRPGQPVAAARHNELVDALNALSTIAGTYPIEVDQDTAGVRIRLAREVKCWLFEIEPFEPPVPRTSDGVAYYAATRVRLDAADEYVAAEPQQVRLYHPTAKDDTAQVLSGEDRVVAVFNADTGRWEIIAHGRAAVPIARFRLNETLSLGGAAEATLQTWDEDASAYADGETITVVDYLVGPAGNWSAPNGYYGFAVKLPDKEEWQILYMEQQAEFVAFTLTGNLSGGSATATFNSFWYGRNTGTATLVHDRQHIHTDATTGDKRIACWDSKLSQYMVIDMKAKAGKLLWAKADDHWVNQPGNGSYVECKKCDDRLGSNPDEAITVYLPRPSNAVDPNVRASRVIGYMIDEQGEAICVTDYLDDRIGTIKIWSGTPADIADGWHLCDGAEGTVNLQQKFVLGAQPDDTSDFDDLGHSADVGQIGGRRTHTHANHPAGTTGTVSLSVTTNMTGSPYASGFTDYGTTGITVVDPLTDTVEHIDHNHFVQIGCAAVASGNGSPIEVVLPLGGSCPDSEVNPLWCTSSPTAMTEGFPSCSPNNACGCVVALSHEVKEPVVSADPLVQGHRHTIGMLPVSGITFSPDTVSPNPHAHTTPALTHDTVNHVPPYYALCYIQRIH